MARIALTTRACVQRWRDLEYLMLKQCLKSKAERLLHNDYQQKM
jgi:hypothetical protein